MKKTGIHRRSCRAARVIFPSISVPCASAASTWAVLVEDLEFQPKDEDEV
jgi:hypothetical protein